jgi:hypothetical protein
MIPLCANILGIRSVCGVGIVRLRLRRSITGTDVAATTRAHTYRFMVSTMQSFRLYSFTALGNGADCHTSLTKMYY